MTLIAGAVAVITLYLLLQMFRSANPAVLARTIKFGGGVVALAVAAFTGLRGELAVAIPLGIFGAGLLGWTPLANAGFGNIGGLFGGGASRRPVRPRGCARRSWTCGWTTIPAGWAARSLPGPMPGAISTSSISPACWQWSQRSTPRAWPYLKAIWTAGFPLGVRTRRAMRQGAAPHGGEWENDGGGSLSDPWPAAGRGA